MGAAGPCSRLLVMLSKVLSCRSHPKYVLERHIARYDLLKPSAQKIGLHRGEAFYLRADLAHLHTVRLRPQCMQIIPHHVEPDQVISDCTSASPEKLLKHSDM